MLTANSCRALAADDRLRAASTELSNQAIRLEASAEAWEQRADFLDRLDDSRRSRTAARD